MCMLSFVALRCVLRKPYGFLDPGELIPATRTATTRLAFWDPPSGSKKQTKKTKHSNTQKTDKGRKSSVTVVWSLLVVYISNFVHRIFLKLFTTTCTKKESKKYDIKRNRCANHTAYIGPILLHISPLN